jgi:hypothetical protein
MNNISSYETKAAIETVDWFLGALAINSVVENYEQFNNLIRNEIHPLPTALSTLIKSHGKFTNYHPCNRVVAFTAKSNRSRLLAEVNFIGVSPYKELITISDNTKKLPVLGVKFKQNVSIDEGTKGSFDIASNDVRSGEHFFFMPKGSDDSIRLTRFVNIAGTLVERFTSLIR